jgi:hypothetical protein
VRLVHHQQAGPVLAELVDHLVLGELLRGQEQELRGAGGKRLPRMLAVAVGLGRVDRDRFGRPRRRQRDDLVTLEGDQRDTTTVGPPSSRAAIW